MAVKTTIAVDAMGGDNSPRAQVEGSISALKAHPELTVILVGQEERIMEELSKAGEQPNERLRIKNATEVIDMAEHPVAAIKRKKDSSMVVALKLVKEGEADAVLSSGNSGALLVGGIGIVGRIRGVERAPFAAVTPTAKGPCMIVDSGANVDCRSSHLVQFARMGSIYMKSVLGIESPRVALLNNGAEEEKGNALVKETFPLLRECKDLNFIGGLEARDFPMGGCDVLVCDGFAGNVTLKVYEGSARFIMTELKGSLMSSLMSKLGALLIKPALKGMLTTFDDTQYGAAPLLGLKGLVLKSHGRASKKEIRIALEQGITFKEKNVSAVIEQGLTGEA